MSQINVTINGRQYRMACEDGQEARLATLAQQFDDRITELRGKFGEIGDSRLTVMAALMVADELADTGHRIRRLEEQIAALNEARVMSADRAKETEAAMSAALNSSAERIEKLIRDLNQTAGGGPIAMG
jgi:cell division protein ZapA